jgi:hypothetical protein
MCTLIQIESKRTGLQTYWIEDERHLVRQVLYPRGNIAYPVVRLNEKMDPALFTYDPKAADARRIHFGANFRLRTH